MKEKLSAFLEMMELRYAQFGAQAIITSTVALVLASTYLCLQW